MCKTKIFKSVFGGLITGYIKEMRACGHKYKKGAALLRRFDELAAKEDLKEAKLSKRIVLAWTQKRPGEAVSTRNGRIRTIRGFATYMVRIGFEAYVYPPCADGIDRYSYVPYIFSEEELRKIFIICDNFPASRFSPNRHITLPLIFRMLYGCGLRISEALNLKLCHVNLKAGTLSIQDAKFNKERIVPMADTLTRRCLKYAKKIHRFSSPDTFFFLSPYGGNYNQSTIYHLFRKVLWKAGISHSGKGPRLHDFRHSFSVHCLKKWVLGKEDITNLLPYLCTYLGHVDLRGTQHYLRLTADLYPEIIACMEEKFSELIPEVISNETD